MVGNIANGSPIADISPAFIALGASLTISHLENKRVIPIQSFYFLWQTGFKEGEFIKSVYVPKLEKIRDLNALKFQGDLTKIYLL